MEKINFQDGITKGNAETFNQLQENIDTSKLDKMVVSKGLDTVGWYRVAKCNNIGGLGNTFLFNINTMYNSNDNMSCTYNINLSYKKAKITAISNSIHNTVVSKIRAVLENDEIYIEIYYSLTQQNGVYIDIIQQDIKDNANVSMLDFEAPTDTATVLDELSIGEFTTGIEYATNEFLDGKRIYKKRINFGALPNATYKNVNVEINDFNYIKHECSFSTSDKLSLSFGSYAVDVRNEKIIKACLSGTVFQIICEGDETAYTGYVTLYYTKN